MTCPDLDIYASDCVKFVTAQYEMLDDDTLDAIEQEACDNVCEQAARASIYYSSCLAIIERYDSQYGKDVEDCGQGFEAAAWEKAMVSYATLLTGVVIQAKVAVHITELRDAYETIEAALPPDVFCKIADACPYGWAAHDSEDDSGLMYWHDLEGELEARAIECGDLCLFASWSKTQQQQQTVEA